MIPGELHLGASVLASIHFGPLQFDRPWWLILIPVLGVIAVVIATVNMSGLGRVTRVMSLVVRLLVIALIGMSLAEPQWRREAKDVATTLVLDTSDSVPGKLREDVTKYTRLALERADPSNERFGLVTVAKDPVVQAMPSLKARDFGFSYVGESTATDLAGGLRSALAIAPSDAMNRIIVASDGNETVGNILKVAELAKAMQIPVDVLPLKFSYDSEVIVERLAAPGSVREGEMVSLRVVINATQSVSGRLAILVNGQEQDLNGDEPGNSVPIELQAGSNVRQLTIPAMAKGALEFEAKFLPNEQAGTYVGDTRPENNVGSTVTFVAGEARVLMVTEDDAAAAPILKALTEAEIKTEVVHADAAPHTLTEFNGYDLIVLMNEPAYSFSERQQEDLRQYVHDSGGGLIMIGGDQSFGAGGWIGSPLEDALPVKLDPPQKRQMPKGALALVMHSIEMPQGVFWGKKVASSAVDALSRLDYVGINEYRGGMGPGTNQGVEWVYPMSLVGDGTRVKQAIQTLQFGDMPDFTPSLELAYQALVKTDAGQRHVIMISDGDPQTPGTSLLDKFRDAKITVSTVGVFPHSGSDTSRMSYISTYTGGRHYHVDTQAALATVPQIFVKEAQTVRRSLIQEYPGGFQPKVLAGISETLRGISSVPVLRGWVVTAEREGLALTTIKAKEGDPILAQWQHGLGKVVAYTSDAATRWNSDWVSWSLFRSFWEQHARWAMRPTGSANVRAWTESRGDETVIRVQALDSSGERLDFARFVGRVAGPAGTASGDVEFKQTGPGMYEAVVPTSQAGTYVTGIRYVAPNPTGEGTLEGSLQVAINRPFADEYRSTRDNAALLVQVAKSTGGRVLTFDPQKDKLWDKAGLRVPVALRPIWLALALAGVGVFLMDVAVRRVRIDIPGIVRTVRRGMGRGAAKGGEQITSLKAARASARQKMSAREMSHAERESIRAAESAMAAAKVKFEASPERAKKPSGEVALGGSEARPTPTAPRPPQKDGGASDPEGMSRLLKAKRKAQDEMQE